MITDIVTVLNIHKNVLFFYIMYIYILYFIYLLYNLQGFML